MPYVPRGSEEPAARRRQRVVWTGGGLDKLEIYRRLGVREVWIWEAGRIAIFVLRDDTWERIARSEILPQVDIALVESLLEIPTQTAAVRALRTRLRHPQ